MAKTFRTREGPLGTAATAGADAWYALTTMGDEQTPGALQVPVGKNRITKMMVSVGDGALTGADWSHNFLVRLTGVDDGEAMFIIGAGQAIFTTAGSTGIPTSAWRFDVDVPVTAGKTISVYGLATAGAQAGLPEMCVTLEFS